MLEHSVVITLWKGLNNCFYLKKISFKQCTRCDMQTLYFTLPFLKWKKEFFFCLRENPRFSVRSSMVVSRSSVKIPAYHNTIYDQLKCNFMWNKNVSTVLPKNIPTKKSHPKRKKKRCEWTNSSTMCLPSHFTLWLILFAQSLCNVFYTYVFSTLFRIETSKNLLCAFWQRHQQLEGMLFADNSQRIYCVTVLQNCYQWKFYAMFNTFFFIFFYSILFYSIASSSYSSSFHSLCYVNKMTQFTSIIAYRNEYQFEIFLYRNVCVKYSACALKPKCVVQQLKEL